MKKGTVSLILLITSAFLITGSIIFDGYSTLSLNEVTLKASKSIDQKSIICKKGLDVLLDKNPAENWQDLNAYYDEEKIGLYVWEKDSVVFWNNSQIPIQINASTFPKSQGLVKLPQGYYIYFKEKRNTKTVLAVCLIKASYELQNNYLKNDFATWTGIPKGIKLDTVQGLQNKVMLEGEIVFSIKGNDAVYYTSWIDNAGFILFFIGFLILLSAILFYIKNSSTGTALFLGISSVIVLRLLMIVLKWPAFFYRSDLYDLQLFGNAQSLLNGYLGDILLNSVTLLFIASVFHFHQGNFTARIGRFIYSVLVIASILLVFNQFNQTAISLINNSTLSFDFLSIFNIKFEAFIGLTALGIYSLALFVLVNRTLSFFNAKSWWECLRFLILYLCLCILEHCFSHRTGFVENYWLLFYAAALLILLRLYGFQDSSCIGITNTFYVGVNV